MRNQVEALNRYLNPEILIMDHLRVYLLRIGMVLVNFANCVVLNIQKAVPIYELVADLAKKAQIKADVEEYMADR